MRTFRAMNTDVTVITRRDESRVAAAVEHVFAEAERRFSRFRADSELSRINRADEPIAVSQPMFDALVRARDYVAMTGGMFDPGIGGALVALGTAIALIPQRKRVRTPTGLAPEDLPEPMEREVVTA